MNFKKHMVLIYLKQILSILSLMVRSFWVLVKKVWGFPGGLVQETWIWFLGQEDPLEKETATHSSTLAWEIPWREEPGRLQSWGCKRIRHNLKTKQQEMFAGSNTRNIFP